MIRVALIGDARVMQPLLADATDMEVCHIDGESINGVVDDLLNPVPDVVVIDHHNTRLDAEILCSFVSRHVPHVHAILLTEANPGFEILQNTGFTARGFVTPEQHVILDKAVRAVFDGEAWLPRRLVAEMLNRFAMIPQ